MAIFEKLINLIKSNINDLLDRGEDPEKMVRLLVSEMEESVISSTNAYAKAMANENKLEKQLLSMKDKSTEFETHAKTAMQKGDEDLAKRILTRKIQIDQQIATYQKMYTDAESTVEHIRKQLDLLKMKLDEAKSQESMLIARSQNAKAREDIAKKIGEIGDNSFADFERLEGKILELESKAEAFETLASENVSLEQEIAALEDNSDLDAAFEQLKLSVGK